MTHQQLIHPGFRFALLSGQKCAFMVQANFFHARPLLIKPDEGVPFVTNDKIIFTTREEVPQPHEVAIAEGVVANGALLDIDANSESIKRQVKLLGVFQWVGLKHEEIEGLIKAEGWGHPDDFWQNIWKRKGATFRCTQIYFDLTKKLVNA
jgi:hypothetical protein